MSDGSPWPRISIVTPSYNQGQFIEETIRSILLQGYPNLEYIIIDGGSIDNSVEIIKKYEPCLAYWVSEPDQGQAHAINKGFARATGAIVQWINSDDLLTPEALAEVARLAITYPAAMIGGGCEQFRPDGSRLVVYNRTLSRERLITFWRDSSTYQQPSLFVPQVAIRACGLLDESLRYCFDLDWTIRLLERFPAVYTDRILARYRLHPDSKTCSEWPRMSAERGVVSARYWDEIGCRWAEREHAAYRRREAWYITLGHLLEAEGRKSTKIGQLFLEALKSPWRLARRETWGAMRRIVISC